MNIKRTWPFWLVVFLVPLLAIILAGICGNEIGIHFINNESNFYLKGSFIHSLVVSVSTSLIAAGVVYLFIDKKLRELLAHDEVITVILKTKEGKTKECPPMSRKDFCRQEVLGYLGMLGGPERFTLSYMKKKEFGNRILAIQQGKGSDKLIIECTDDELKQFDPDHHENDDITVVLQSKSNLDNKITCPPMPRKTFSRAEVLGYIGMMSGAQRFEIASLKTPQFGADLLNVAKSKGAQLLVVHCTDKEIEQFKAP
ncbi:hypothetical protein [Vibrio spartinae]|uniref:Uncharacterized protein n=1 Tax=Vibrio spartinae TaxID=1918945 RepID=A0A1N6MAZ9_9VIBR|nr:hypothetical protein [Vibrio spartinae]SIO96520.1 hypothetical protein VSP9026_04323 [Vibrio spartinae]